MNGVVYDVFKKVMPKDDGYIIPTTTKNKSDAFREQIESKAPGLFVESVVIENGTMTITGHNR